MDITVTNPKTGKPQVFEVRMKDISFVRTGEFAGAYSDCPSQVPNLYKLEDQLAKVDKATFNCLTFNPLTEEGAKTPKGERQTKHHRGGEEYITHDQRIPDANPFVIRKVAINNMVVGNGWEDYQGYKQVLFRSWGSTELTPGQATQLKEWFSTQLVEAVTKDVMDFIKKTTKEELIAHAKKDINLIRGWLDLLEKFEG